MNSKVIRKGMDAVFNELMSLPEEEFRHALETEGNGDIAAILLYTGALHIRVTEVEKFALPHYEVQVVTLANYRRALESRFVTEQPVTYLRTANYDYASRVSMTLLKSLETITYSTRIDDNLKCAA